ETGEGPILNKTIEVHALKKDKTEITISLSICPTRAKNKYQFIGFIRDITERKIAEERLIDSELKLKEAQALGHISNWEVNLVTNIHTWSEEFYNIFGIKREDISPSPESFLSLLHPDDVSHVSERVTKTFQTNEAGSLNSRFIKKDGSVGYIYSEWKFEFDQKKKPTRLYGILQDITESSRAEEKIRTSEANLAEAQRLAKMGSWNYDFKRDILTWSEELYNVFDTDKETFIETHGSFLHLIDPMDREFVLATGKNTQATGEPFEIEYNITTTKGEHRVIQERGYGEKDKQGNVVRLFGTAQNITERKKSSDALQKALTDLNKILDSSLDVICTINGNGEFINVSTASQQVWGYKPEELIGSKFMKLVYDEDAEVTAKAAETILSGTQVPTFENRYVHKSGRIVPILWSMNWDEELQLMFCIAKDVTEKKRLKKAVETERDQFFDMFLNAPSAIGMLKGTDHVFEMANPLYLQLTGKKDVIGKTAAELFPEAIEQGIIGMLDHVYHTGETHIGTDVLLKVDKEGKGELTDFYTNFVCQAYRNGMGEIAGVFFFMNIITEQILSRKAIEKSEKQYRQIVETAQEGIWLRDAMNRTTFVNNKLCEILEYSEEEMMGKEIFYFMNETWKKVAAAAIERRKKGISENIELSFVTKSGKNIWTNISSNPMLDENGVY
ncbi:MAG: PAS domain S-box protein, partial [Flavisolibacter sp.]|nr:PAS domain S-box protein [Flavisolibacter sp.]